MTDHSELIERLEIGARAGSRVCDDAAQALREWESRANSAIKEFDAALEENAKLQVRVDELTETVNALQQKRDWINTDVSYKAPEQLTTILFSGYIDMLMGLIPKTEQALEDDEARFHHPVSDEEEAAIESDGEQMEPDEDEHK